MATTSPVARDLRTWLARVRECRHPVTLASGLRHVLARRRLLRLATGRPAAVTGGLVREIEDDRGFLDEIRAGLARWTTYRPRAVDFMLLRDWGSVFFNEVTLYALVRALAPALVVETGGTPGKSTAFILRALQRNGTGRLYTIDVPPPPADRALVAREQVHDWLPTGLGSCWLVPEEFRSRHTLLLGRSRDALPPLLAKLPPIDLFLHDSDHGYENMRWEFETAWPRLAPGGLLVSDDVQANTAFSDFCRARSLAYARVFNLGVTRAIPPATTPAAGG
jgi:predicted O-methyltransferase YrrM